MIPPGHVPFVIEEVEPPPWGSHFRRCDVDRTEVAVKAIRTVYEDHEHLTALCQRHYESFNAGLAGLDSRHEPR